MLPSLGHSVYLGVAWIQHERQATAGTRVLAEYRPVIVVCHHICICTFSSSIRAPSNVHCVHVHVYYSRDTMTDWYPSRYSSTSSTSSTSIPTGSSSMLVACIAFSRRCAYTEEGTGTRVYTWTGILGQMKMFNFL